jgi:hypothetical protein
MRRQPATGENFFIAKNCDSESARGAFGLLRRLAASCGKCNPLMVRMLKTLALKAFSANSIIVDAGFSRAFQIG